MQTVKLNGTTLTLPPEAAQQVAAGDEFALLITDDTIILKKLRPARPSEIAKRAPKEKAPSLREIANEVHRYRESRRARRP